MDESNARIPSVHIGQFEPVPPDVIALIPLSLIQKQKVIPLKKFSNHLLVAAPKASDVIKPEGLALVVGCPVEIVTAPLDEIDTFIKRHYASQKPVKKMMVIPAELIVSPSPSATAPAAIVESPSSNITFEQFAAQASPQPVQSSSLFFQEPQPPEPPIENRLSLIVGGPMPDLVEEPQTDPAGPDQTEEKPLLNFLVPEANASGAEPLLDVDEMDAAYVSPPAPKTIPNFESILPDPVEGEKVPVVPPTPSTNLVTSSDPSLPAEFMTVMSEAAVNRSSEVLVTIKGDRYEIRQRIRGTLLPMAIGKGGLYPSQIEKLVAWVASVGERQYTENLEWFDVHRELKFGDTLYLCQAFLTFTKKSKILTFRINSQREGVFSPSSWGMDQSQAKAFSDFLDKKQGVILFVGSNRDGINSNMYASARHLSSLSRHVMAVEPAMESWMADIDHFSTKGDSALMGNFLGKVFQHAPDVVIANPLEEKKHFDLCLSESLKGTLVFGRTYASDTVEGLYQILSLGVEPFLAASSLVGIVSQRTIRLNCPACQTKDTTARSQARELGIPETMMPPFFFVSKGCDGCHGTGFSGEADIFEVLPMSSDLKNILSREVKLEALRSQAKTSGLISLRQMAIRKATNGQTSLAEVVRSTPK